jgi:MFS family permease
MNKAISLLLVTVSLRRLAVNLLALFSSLFIFQLLAVSGQQVKQSLSGVAAYFLCFYLVKLLFFPLAEKTAFKFGFKWSIFYSIFPFFFYIVFLILSSQNIIFLIPASFFGGFQAAFFWFGYHGLFVKFGDENRFGLQTGMGQMLNYLLLILAPLLGSFLILNFGFNSLFFAAFFFACISALIILISPLIKPHQESSLIRIFALFKSHPRVFFSYLGWGGEAALYSAFWPIFLILIFESILSYGGIVSASTLLAILLSYFIGNLIDKMKSGKVIRAGIFLGVLTWGIRIISHWPLLIVFLDGFYRLSEQMLSLAMDVFSYKKARQGGTCQALFFREISLSLGAAVFLFLTILFLFLNFPLWIIFVLGLLGSLSPILINRKI